MHLRALRLPTTAQIVEELIAKAEQENWSLEAFTRELFEQEIEGRRMRRTPSSTDGTGSSA